MHDATRVEPRRLGNELRVTVSHSPVLAERVRFGASIGARQLVGAAALLFAFGIGSEVDAAVVSYTSDIAFQAALGSYVIETFDSFTRTQGPDILGTYLPLDQQILGIDFDNARINLGAFGGTFRSPSNVVLNADLVNPIVISFAVPQFGAGLYNTSLVDAERFQIFDTSDNLLGSIDLGAQVINFGGFTSDVGIARIRVTPIAPTNGSIYIDDLTLAAAAPVSEPSTVWLIALAASLLIGQHLRSRRVAVRSGQTSQL